MVHFTEADVQYLMSDRKTVARVIHWRLKGQPKSISLEIRRVADPHHDNLLRLNGRLEAARLARPGIVLAWQGIKIRGVDHAFHHSSFLNEIEQERIKGWHEHIWSVRDGFRFAVPARPPIRTQDLLSVMHWCFEKWNIEKGAIPQMRLGERQ